MMNFAGLLYMLLVGSTYMLLLTESRYSFKKTCAIAYGIVAVIAVVDVFVHQQVGLVTFAKLFALINHLPLFVLFWAVSRKRGWRALFLVLTATLFCFFVHQLSVLAWELSGEQSWAFWLSLLVLGTVAVPLLIVKFLRPRYFAGFAQIDHGWWLMCLVIAIYYVINIYLIPDFFGTSTLANVVKPAITALMVGFYAALVLLFSSARRETEARESARLLSMRLSAINDRLEASRAAEETVRIERHDMRHRLQTLAELVSRGDTETALAFIDASQRRLDAQRPVAQWCHQPVLDAVFATYFSQAKRNDITVEARIALPERLPVDEAEFAVVCANALENAINACRTLPEAERRIRCSAIGRPGVVLEVANPCPVSVRFDEEDLPVALEAGHGVGVRSIAAFARKHGATYEFKAEDGWFTFTIVL